jgi:glycopeptide antibiotics resistance protein
MLNGLLPSSIIVLIFLLIFGLKFFKGYITGLHYFYWIIFGLYIAGVVFYTLFPVPYQKFLIETMIKDNLGLPHNLIPFNGIKEAVQFNYYNVVLKQIGGNILLFIPLGFALPVLFPGTKNSKVVIIGFLGSLTIEIIQLIAGKFIGYNYRAFDVDDLLMNTLGTIIGLLVFKLLYEFLKKNELLVTTRQKTA